jgi:hypothetical protein
MGVGVIGFAGGIIGAVIMSLFRGRFVGSKYE